jgi:glycosyltransferase involved in cell wall biosynthesis
VASLVRRTCEYNEVKMKKVLILTYEFPPSNNVAIHRILRFGKWLPKYNWEPIILTPAYNLSERIDIDNVQFVKKYFEKVYRTSSSYEKIYSLIADKKNRNPLIRFIRHYILNKVFSDKSIIWERSAIDYGIKVIKKEKIDAIWATIGPFTTGMIGAELKRRMNVPLLIDYRDPWTLNPYRNYKNRRLRKYIKYEQGMLKVADAVITTSEFIKELLVINDYYDKHKINVITNGYDEELQWINDNSNDSLLDNNKFNITYAGSFYSDRQPYSFIEGLKLFIDEYPQYTYKIKFNIIGNLDYSRNIEKFCKEHNLNDILYERGLIPFRVAMQYLKQSDLLLLVNGVKQESKIFIPGKLFDYMVTKKPVLFIGEGQPREIVSKTRIGESANHDAVEIKNKLSKLILNYTDYQYSDSAIQSYKCENISKNITTVLNNII